MKTPVTMVTRDATLDDLSAGDYREIYDELRKRHDVTGEYTVSLDKFVALVASQYSKAQWGKYNNGETTLTRTMRNELRRCVGLPLLPPTVAEATATASPDAAVWQVGDGAAEHVIMVSAGDPVTFHVNGSVSVVDANVKTDTTQNILHVTAVTRARRRYVRPIATDEQDARREALGAKWQTIIERGLAALESEQAE